MADHAQTAVNAGFDVQGLLAAEWRVLQPNEERPETAELAVAPTRASGGVYVLADGRRGDRAHDDVRSRLRDAEGSDVIAWLAGPDGKRIVRDGIGVPDLTGAEAVIEGGRGSGVAGQGAELRFRPGRGRGPAWWELGPRRRPLGSRPEAARRQAPLPQPP